MRSLECKPVGDECRHRKVAQNVELYIANKAEHDPVADLLMVDSHMRWPLVAAEEVIGKPYLDEVLRASDLARYIEAYPPNKLTYTGKSTFGDYATLNAGLIGSSGPCDREQAERIGRLVINFGINLNGPMFGTATLAASKLLPAPARLKLGMSVLQNGYRKISQAAGQDRRLRVEDKDDHFLYIAEDCQFCAGKQCSNPICLIFTSMLTEGGRWLLGKHVAVEEIACRAMGAPACIWKVSKYL